jgi:hypothetical protein
MATRRARRRAGDTVEKAIAAAERLLPGVALSDDAYPDPRWQAIIRVGFFIESDPDEVWAFAAKWGCRGDKDLRGAIATCLVEHLLEYHFNRVFPRIEELAMKRRRFADVFLSCWEFGQSERPKNRRRLNRLRRRLGEPTRRKRKKRT